MGIKDDPENWKPAEPYKAKANSIVNTPKKIEPYKEQKQENLAYPTAEKDSSEKNTVQGIYYGEWDLNKVLQTVLLALSNVSKKHYYGVNVLTDVLRGSSSKRILDAKLDNVPEYGTLANMQRQDVATIIGWLIENKYILQTKAQYPVLHPTYNGLHYNEIITKGQLLKLLRELERGDIID